MSDVKNLSIGHHCAVSESFPIAFIFYMIVVVSMLAQTW